SRGLGDVYKRQALSHHRPEAGDSIDALLAADRQVRDHLERNRTTWI
ncbi:MAG: hypothetical protein IMF16_03355, partial [Proteobacteria bacterium]|nr:hypothetical protein [Pseudomonadota bacterium]